MHFAYQVTHCITGSADYLLCFCRILIPPLPKGVLQVGLLLGNGQLSFVQSLLILPPACSSEMVTLFSNLLLSSMSTPAAQQQLMLSSAQAAAIRQAMSSSGGQLTPALAQALDAAAALNPLGGAPGSQLLPSSFQNSNMVGQLSSVMSRWTPWKIQVESGGQQQQLEMLPQQLQQVWQQRFSPVVKDVAYLLAVQNKTVTMLAGGGPGGAVPPSAAAAVMLEQETFRSLATQMVEFLAGNCMWSMLQYLTDVMYGAGASAKALYAARAAGLIEAQQQQQREREQQQEQQQQEQQHQRQLQQQEEEQQQQLQMIALQQQQQQHLQLQGLRPLRVPTLMQSEAEAVAAAEDELPAIASTGMASRHAQSATSSQTPAAASPLGLSMQEVASYYQAAGQPAAVGVAITAGLPPASASAAGAVPPSRRSSFSNGFYATAPAASPLQAGQHSTPAASTAVGRWWGGEDIDDALLQRDQEDVQKAATAAAAARAAGAVERSQKPPPRHTPPTSRRDSATSQSSGSRRGSWITSPHHTSTAAAAGGGGGASSGGLTTSFPDSTNSDSTAASASATSSAAAAVENYYSRLPRSRRVSPSASSYYSLSSSGSLGSFSGRAGSMVTTNGSSSSDGLLQLQSSSSPSHQWPNGRLSLEAAAGKAGASQPQQQQQEVGVSGRAGGSGSGEGRSSTESGIANVRRREKGEGGGGGGGGGGDGGQTRGSWLPSAAVASSSARQLGSTGGSDEGKAAGAAGGIGGGLTSVKVLKAMLGMADVRWREVHLLLLSYVIVALLVMLLLRG